MDKAYLQICDFDLTIYRSSNNDLDSLSDEELENHFLKFGIGEGRYFNHVKNRRDFVDNVKNDGKMLEVGPLDNPQLDYLSPHYYSLDVFNRERLIQNYIDHPDVDKNKILEPSFVISDNDYSVIKEKFGSIFSSHNIEHLPCLVSSLNSLGNLLNDDGRVYLIIPDKRYCFDHFKRETDIFDVLQAYFDNNVRPKLADVLKMATQVTHNNCVDHWKGMHGSINTRSALKENFEKIVQQYSENSYVDSHVSAFTPQSFKEIIDTLNELNLINLKVEKLYHTLLNNIEFYTILKKSIREKE